MTRPIFHITHIDNLRSIIGAGGLWSDARRIQHDISVTNIGLGHIKQRRLRRPVPVAAKGMLGEYVPFNFCSRSVMLYACSVGHDDYRGGQRHIVHLVSNVQAATVAGGAWAFTDRHADLKYALYYDDLRYLDRVDWGVMPLRYWADSTEVKEKRQAEFLVHSFFPWRAIEAVGVIDQGVAGAVGQRLRSASHMPRIVVEPAWYY